MEDLLGTIENELSKMLEIPVIKSGRIGKLPAMKVEYVYAHSNYDQMEAQYKVNFLDTSADAEQGKLNKLFEKMKRINKEVWQIESPNVCKMLCRLRRSNDRTMEFCTKDSLWKMTVLLDVSITKVAWSQENIAGVNKVDSISAFGVSV